MKYESGPGRVDDVGLQTKLHEVFEGALGERFWVGKRGEVNLASMVKSLNYNRNNEYW
jgi:hypothetical protein